MLSRLSILFPGSIVFLVLMPLHANAKSSWQEPTVKICNLGPSVDCNIEAKCPADMPYIVTGAGGLPMTDPSNHSLAMTMNSPTRKDTWRVRWRNLSSDQTVKVKALVRIKCSDSATEAGW